MKRLILGTRGSALALAQAELTQVALLKAWQGLEIERRIFVTRGDQKLDLDLMREPAGGKGLFTKELEEALLAGTIDIAVHSLKDLPGHNPPGLEITAVLERASTADVLITKGLRCIEDFPKDAHIGTSSVRRARQLRWLRPDLVIKQWRGNVPTRLRKFAQRDDVAGIVLAEAGLARLGYQLANGILHCEDAKFTLVSLEDHLLPAIGQGVIAIQTRADRDDVNAVLAPINHERTFLAVRAEREFQRLLCGDCALPVGVRAAVGRETIEMNAILFSSDDSKPPMRAQATGSVDRPEEVAAKLFASISS